MIRWRHLLTSDIGLSGIRYLVELSTGPILSITRYDRDSGWEIEAVSGQEPDETTIGEIERDTRAMRGEWSPTPTMLRDESLAGWTERVTVVIKRLERAARKEAA